MNDKTLKKLEYDKIINMLVGECSSSLGQELAGVSFYPFATLGW